MSEAVECSSELVRLQSNDLVRDENGKILGLLISHDKWNDKCEQVGKLLDCVKKDRMEFSKLQVLAKTIPTETLYTYLQLQEERVLEVRKEVIAMRNSFKEKR